MSVVANIIMQMEDHIVYGIRNTEETETGFACWDELHTGAKWKSDFEENKNSDFYLAVMEGQDELFRSGKTAFFKIEDVQIV